MFNFYFDSSLCEYFHSRLSSNLKQMFRQPKSLFYLFFGLGTYYMGFSFWKDFVFSLLSDALCVVFFPSSTCLTFYSLPLLISSEKASEKAPEPEPEPEPFDNTSYKNLQHHHYNMYTFADMDVEMSKHRLPQPSAGRHWVFVSVHNPVSSHVALFFRWFADKQQALCYNSIILELKTNDLTSSDWFWLFCCCCLLQYLNRV